MSNWKLAIALRVSVALQVQDRCLDIRSRTRLTQIVDKLVPSDEAERIGIVSKSVYDCCTVVILVRSPCRSILVSLLVLRKYGSE